MGRFPMLEFFYRQHVLSVPELPKDLDLTGQTAIVTGSNGGLGYHSAHQLVDHRLSTLIIAVRSRQKGDNAATKIRNDFVAAHPDWPLPTIKVWDLDMSRYSSVLAFAKKVKDEAGHVDIAILNAGVQPDSWQVSPEGHELTVQVNYLSTALLALELRQIMHTSYVAALKSGNPPKRQPVLDLVGSDATTFATLPELAAAEQKGLGLIEAMRTEDAKLGTKYVSMNRYGDSKLLEHAFFIEFIRRLPAPSPSSSAAAESGNEVIVNLVSPGLCKTELGDYQGVAALLWAAFRGINGRRADVGARTLTLAGTVGREGHGVYFSEGRWFPQPDFLQSDKGRETAVKLWDEMSQEFKKAGVDVESLMGGGKW